MRKIEETRAQIVVTGNWLVGEAEALEAFLEEAEFELDDLELKGCKYITR